MRKWLLILSALIVVLLGILLLRASRRLPDVALVVSRETTYFTEPLNPDGTVDYVAAYNRRFGADAATSGNMAVRIIGVLGPGALSAEVREPAAAALGVTFSESRRGFVRLADHLNANPADYEGLIQPEREQAAESEDERWRREVVTKGLGGLYRQRSPLEELADSQVAQATTGPWSASDLRIVADWIAVNEAVLDEISALERGTKFVVPMVSPVNPPEFLPPAVLDADVIRDLWQTLVCRAMLRLGRDDMAGAWDDALLMCYLGRLMMGGGSGGHPYQGLVPRTEGLRIIRLIAGRADLAPAQAIDMLRQYQALPAAGSPVEADVLISRLTSLDFVMQLVRGGTPMQSSGVDVAPPVLGSFDPNDVMRRINSVYDAIEEVATHPDLHQRMALAPATAAANRALLSALERRMLPDNFLEFATLRLSPTARREFSNDALVWHLLAMMMMDATATSTDVQAAMNDESASIALALAAHKAEHGRYPGDLDDLVPSYLPVAPRDLFTGERLHYKSDGERYRVWSVGRNLRDDGGDGEDDLVLAADD
jgi:hypothetical protein